MKVLWAPWRMEYILSDKTGSCFICEAAQVEPSASNLLLYRTGNAVVMMNRYPYSNGHLLVAPIWHTPDLSELPPEHFADLMDLFRFSLKALEEAMSPEGFNAGLNLGKSAGAGLADHLHWHIVPRWQGDTNFMPVIAGERVMPEALGTTYDRIYPLFSDYPAWKKSLER